VGKPVRFLYGKEGIHLRKQTWYISGHEKKHEYLGPKLKMNKRAWWLNKYGRDINYVFGEFNYLVLDCYDWAKQNKKIVVLPGFGLGNDFMTLENWGFGQFPALEILKSWAYDPSCVFWNYGCQLQNLRWCHAYTMGEIYIDKKDRTDAEVHEAAQDNLMAEQCYNHCVGKKILLSPMEFHDRKPHNSQLPEDFVAFVNKYAGFVQNTRSMKEYRFFGNTKLVAGEFQNFIVSTNPSSIVVDVGDEDDDDDDDHFIEEVEYYRQVYIS